MTDMDMERAYAQTDVQPCSECGEPCGRELCDACAAYEEALEDDLLYIPPFLRRYPGDAVEQAKLRAAKAAETRANKLVMPKTSTKTFKPSASEQRLIDAQKAELQRWTAMLDQASAITKVQK
jgi:hypothetical protein